MSKATGTLGRRRLVWIIALGALVAIVGVAVTVAVVRARMDEARYLERRAVALERFASVPELEASPFPAMGVRIVRINPGHQAEGLGLTAGAVVVSIGGEPIRADFEPRDRTMPMVFITPEGERREVRVRPGTIGIRNAPYRRPELAYIRSAQRDPALDADMLAAIATRRRDPELAETALQRVLAGGYEPDELSNSVAAMIALHQGRPTVAQEFASRMELVPDEGGGTYGLNPIDRYRIALANGNLDDMVRLAERYDGPVSVSPQALENVLALAAERGSPPNPDRLLSEGLARRDLRPQMHAVDDERLVASNLFGALEANQPFVFSTPPGRFRLIAATFERGGFNYEFVIRGELFAAPRSTRWQNTLGMLALDLEADAGSSGGLTARKRMTAGGIWLSRTEDASTSVAVGGGFSPHEMRYRDPAIDLGRSWPFEIRLICVDGWAQVVLNDVPVALLPAEARRPALIMQVVGARAQIEAVELSELVAE
ncbi:MAG: hypothetical protein WD316_00025 [Phycisphaeraceae bacterium]